jgi:hypothetical protein
MEGKLETKEEWSGGYACANFFSQLTDFKSPYNLRKFQKKQVSFFGPIANNLIDQSLLYFQASTNSSCISVTFLYDFMNTYRLYATTSLVWNLQLNKGPNKSM